MEVHLDEASQLHHAAYGSCKIDKDEGEQNRSLGCFDVFCS